MGLRLVFSYSIFSRIFTIYRVKWRWCGWRRAEVTLTGDSPTRPAEDPPSEPDSPTQRIGTTMRVSVADIPTRRTTEENAACAATQSKDLCCTRLVESSPTESL